MIPLLAAMLLLAPTSLASAEVLAAPPPAVRYLTLNLLHGGLLSGLTGNDQDLEGRLAVVAADLRALAVDVVGLQEASWSRQRGNVAARLAAELGFHHVYAPAAFRNRLVAPLMNFTEGPAILSRFPIVRWESHDLPRCGRLVDPRVLLFAEVQTPWGRLAVFSTHTSGDPCHTRRVVELVQERRGALPAVLMGDFNAVEGSPAIAALTDEAGFFDAFRLANPTAAPPTQRQVILSDSPSGRLRRASGARRSAKSPSHSSSPNNPHGRKIRISPITAYMITIAVSGR